MPSVQIDPARQGASAERYNAFLDPSGAPKPATAEAIVAATLRQALSDYGSNARYGKLSPAPAEDLKQLRRQQAEFDQTRREISQDNAWMAAPALAPVGAVLLAELGGAVAARLAPRVIKPGPLVLSERDPYLRVGDNWATRAGRRAHAALKARVNAKPGWAGEQTVNTESGAMRPDVLAPARNPAQPPTRYQMELKPNTPSGRRAGAKAVERYTKATGNKTRVIYYDPLDFI